MIELEIEGPFKGYRVYGPYFGETEGRYLIVLVSNNHRTTMSYARYLMCLQENRWLEKHEIVDHKDDDQINDVIENLQIYSRSQNRNKNSSIAIVTLVCPYCKKSFVRRRHQTHLVKGGIQTFCSHSCASKYKFLPS